MQSRHLRDDSNRTRYRRIRRPGHSLQNAYAFFSGKNTGQIYAFSYSYDATGNRLQMRRESTAGTQLESAYYSYAADNSIIKRFVQPAGNSTYWYYDANGNATVINDTSAGATYYAYGPHQLVTAIAPPAATQAPTYFYYDSRLNRYCQNLAGTVTYYLWDGPNLLEERSSTGALNVRYSHGYTQTPGIGSVIEAQRTAGGATYYQYLCMDHRGTVAAVADVNQNTLLAYTQDTFGRQLAGIGGSTPGVPNELIYQTNWRTPLIGGQHYWLSPSRIGDPIVGRFLSRDALPNLKKTMSRKTGNVYGIFNATLFVDEINSAIAKDLAYLTGWQAFLNKVTGINPDTSTSVRKFFSQSVAVRNAIYSTKLTKTLIERLPFTLQGLTSLNFPQSETNWYEYADNNPIAIADPSGLGTTITCTLDKKMGKVCRYVCDCPPGSSLGFMSKFITQPCCFDDPEVYCADWSDVGFVIALIAITALSENPALGYEIGKWAQAAITGLAAAAALGGTAAASEPQPPPPPPAQSSNPNDLGGHSLFGGKPGGD